jgi:peptidoglycan/xylan/chitin deacetylase (PgdA/CDA1 family)
VHASFFLIGRNALAQAALARRILNEGHTVAHHSFSHPLLARIAPSAAKAEIDRGFAAVDEAVYGRTEHAPTTPFFRFPGFASSPMLLEWLEQRGITVFGTDLWVDDWNPISPQQELALALGRIEANQGGIVLLHDSKARTAAMLPALLRALKVRGYRVVHVVSPTQDVK